MTTCDSRASCQTSMGSDRHPLGNLPNVGRDQLRTSTFLPSLPSSSGALGSAAESPSAGDQRHRDDAGQEVSAMGEHRRTDCTENSASCAYTDYKKVKQKGTALTRWLASGTAQTHQSDKTQPRPADKASTSVSAMEAEDSKFPPEGPEVTIAGN